MYITHMKPANNLHGKPRAEFNYTEKTAQLWKIQMKKSHDMMLGKVYIVYGSITQNL